LTKIDARLFNDKVDDLGLRLIVGEIVDGLDKLLRMERS